jgi:acyl dehydratase
MSDDTAHYSDWITITQDDIDLFARVTRDNDPMHVDPAWSAEKGPFPTTVAFGFLTLSLITHMSHEAGVWTDPDAYALNYGFDRLRFVAPVPVNSRVRGRFEAGPTEPRADGSLLTRTKVTVEIEGSERPALVADWLGMAYPAAAQRKMA